jgi:hypothetical protein
MAAVTPEFVLEVAVIIQYGHIIMMEYRRMGSVGFIYG